MTKASEDRFDASPLRQILVMLVAIKIVGIVLIFDIQGLQAFDFPKSLFSRSMEWLIAGVLVAAIVRFGMRIAGSVVTRSGAGSSDMRFVQTDNGILLRRRLSAFVTAASWINSP
jgi:hypothetical protein